MKRMLLALAAAAGVVLAGTASADPGGYVPPKPGSGSSVQIGGPGTLLGAGGLPPGQAADCHGWHPTFKRFSSLFHHKSGGAPTYNGHNPTANPANWGAAGYGVGGPAYNPQGYPPGAGGPNGPIMQGTLAFPHQPFIRSPRDFFMLDLNK